MPRKVSSTYDALCEFAKAAGLPVDVIAALPMPAWGLYPSRGRSKPAPLGTTHIGGGPHAPADFAWPRDRAGLPLTFLFQVACAGCPLPGFPDTGWLLFFARLEDEQVDAEPNNAAVCWLDVPVSALRATAPPTTLPSGALIPDAHMPDAETAQAVSVAIDATLPDSEDLVWDMLGLKLRPAHVDRWHDLVQGLGDLPAIRIGGYALPWQADPRCYVAASPVGDVDNDEAEEVHNRRIAERGLAWTQLAEFESNESRCFYVIPATDLAARKFGRVRLIVQFD